MILQLKSASADFFAVEIHEILDNRNRSFVFRTVVYFLTQPVELKT